MNDVNNKKIFSENLKYYMNINGVDRNKLCKDLKYKYSTVRDWDMGNVYPRIDKIQKIADYFGIKKSDLTEKRDPSLREVEIDALLTKYITKFSKNKIEEELLIKSTMLIDENQKKVLDIVDLYLKNQNDYYEK